MAYLLGIARCPRCGDEMCSPIRSLRTPNVYVQTCRNFTCMYCHRTVVDVAPDPERPRTQSLFSRVEPAQPESPRPTVKSAIGDFERAYQAGDTRKLINRTRRQVKRTDDGQQRRLGRDA